MTFKNIAIIAAVFAAAWYIGKKGWLSGVPIIGPVLGAL